MKKTFLLVGLLLQVIAVGAWGRKQSVTFRENNGQLTDQAGQLRNDILYYGNTSGLSYFLKKDGVSYQLYKKYGYDEGMAHRLWYKEQPANDSLTIQRIDIQWLGANVNAPLVEGTPVGGFDNYYLAHCPAGIINVRSFSTLTYISLYPNINLKYYDNNGALEYDYMVAPGGDPGNIKLEVKGLTSIKQNQDGSLTFTTQLGKVTEAAPLAFQGKQRVAAKWVVNGNILSFHIAAYDKTQQLVIDPLIRTWATYFGGTGPDRVTCNIPDNQGHLYLTGNSSSSSIATTGAYQTTIFGGNDAFLAKCDTNSTKLWCTLYGGNSSDCGNACRLDGSGHLVMVGYTLSANFPVNLDAYHPAFGGVEDGFIAKFDTAGHRIRATFFGGAAIDYINTGEIDDSGNIYVSGLTASTANIAPGTYGGGNSDAFMAKFDSSGDIIWAKYYGGSNSDNAFLTLGPGHTVYLYGTTLSSNGISSPGAYQTSLSSSENAFLAKFNSFGVRQWGTYYGTNLSDAGLTCIVNDSGFIYLGGVVFEGSANYGFMLKMDTGGGYQWGHFYGGVIQGCAQATDGNIVVCGTAYPDSIANGLSVATPGAFQTSYSNINGDGFLGEITPAGGYVYGTYYGGSDGGTYLNMCAMENNGIVYACGETQASGLSSPNTFQPSLSGSSDGLIVKFNQCSSPIPSISAANISACTGDTAFLSTPSLSGVTYIWSKDLVTIAGATSSTYGATTAGSYAVTVVNNGCPSISSPLNITLKALPAATLNSYSITICEGSSTILTAPTLDSVTYQWKDNGATISGATNHTYAATDSGHYNVTVTNTYTGCSATSLTAAAILKPSPVDSVTNLTPLKFCLGDSVILQAATGANYTYYWKLNNVNIPGATNSTYHASIAGAYKVKISLATCWIITDPLNVVTSSITDQASVITDAHCTNNGGNIQLTSAGGVAPYAYNWDNPSSTSNPLTGLHAGNYIVTIHDSINCTLKDTFTVHQSTLPYFSDPLPQLCAVTIDSTTGKNIVIWEKTGSVRATQYKIYRDSSVGGVYNLLTTQPESQLSTFTDASSVPLQQSYSYRISEMDSCGNESALSNPHKTIHLTSNVGIGGAVNLSWNLYEGRSYNMHHIMRDDGTGFYQLDQVPSTTTNYTDNNPFSGPSNYRIDIDLSTACVPAEPTNYARITSNKTYVTPEGITCIAASEAVQVAPNPSSGDIFIIGEKPATVRVTDIVGRELLTVVYKNDLSIRDLQPGVYMISLYHANGTLYHRENVVKK